MIKKLILTILSVLTLTVPALPQGGADYISLYQNRDYQKSLDVITTRLTSIYDKMVEEKRIPSGFFSMSKVGEDTDLLKHFRNRRERGFFIEDNRELTDLHFYAARCCTGLGRKRDSLNHYVQALRFRKIEPGRDDVLFYEIAQVFRSYKEPIYFKGYIDALEQAYTLNTMKYSYSGELGEALYTTKDVKKAIFHLRRYVDNSDEEIKGEIYLKLGNLYEGIERYLETENYYNEYLRLKPDDTEIHFALGHIAYTRTGNYILAESSLLRALKSLKEKDIYRRSKSHEYLGDMAFNNLKYSKAVNLYQECINYQQRVLDLQKRKEGESRALQIKINELKSVLIKDRNFERYEDYEILLDERNRLEREIEGIKYEFNRLNPGRVRWYMALSYEKQEKYSEAVTYYREAVRYDYNANNARDNIVKLQLKIKRGY